jgi:hypothetical protein
LYLLGSEWQLRSWKFRRYDVTNLAEGLAGTSIACPSRGPDLYRAYLAYLVDSGLLDPPRT